MARSFRILPRDAKSLARILAAVAMATGLAAGKADAAASGAFLPHQALYDLNLLKSRGSNSINSARGRILYNFTGSACEGYTSEFRQVSEMDSGEGKVTLSDLRSTSWEDGEGKSYRFKINSRMNDTEFEPGRRHSGADRRSHHGQIETAPGQDVHARRLDGISDRANSAHHRRRERGQIRARADGL